MAPLRRTFFGILMAGMFLAIVFRLSIPPMGHESGGNEAAAGATLRNLAACEAQIRDSGKVDVDGDGIGEYAFFQEMTGSAGLRIDPRGARRKFRINPAILSPAFSNVDARGCAFKAGYVFHIYLPGSEIAAVAEGLAGAPYSGPVATDSAEKHWCAYAWPVSRTNSGIRAFFVNESGEVYAARNDVRKYQGCFTPPDWNAALPPGAGWGASPDPSAPATDGETWTKVR